MKIKNFIILFICTGLFTLLFSSCVKYLDKAPESAFTEEEVFGNYNNFMTYFDGLYKGQTYATNDITMSGNANVFLGFNLYLSGSGRRYSVEQLTDFTDGGKLWEGHVIKGGVMGGLLWTFYDRYNHRPILTTMFSLIRTCNTALEKVHLVKDASPEQINDIIAQAHFVRAYAHFNFFRFWGSMPYITKVIGGDDQWDIPRLSKHETLLRIAADLDTAVTYFEKANLMRRDNPVVGGVGHLNNPDMFRPNGVTAKAFKGRVLLYAASPLNNELGAKDWEEAAKANWEAIQIALSNGYFLLNAANYKQNWIGVNYGDEQLGWAWATGPLKRNAILTGFLINGVFAKNTTTSADCPTQGAVDKFETKWGDPLNTQEDRDAATAIGHYNEQDPYKDREPRFYIDIIYNQAPIPGYGTAKIYVENVGGNTKYSELLDQKYAGITHTGYYGRKLWGEHSIKNDIQPLHTDPWIRLTELYLNYAEAANEAYGPNTAAPGATLTAVQAVNLIRQRIGHVDVQSQFTDTKENFRSRMKNERIVELASEGHYYFDIRRWLDAPVTMKGPLMGMVIEKVPVSAEYPIGFKHSRAPLPANRQSVWKDEMLYFPFYDADYYKMKNFDASLNPRW